MTEIAINVQKNGEKAVRRVAMAIGTTVVMATPVDTGRARANWIASLDTPSTQISDASGRVGELGETAEIAGATIRHIRGVARSYRLGRSIHISNSLSYIMELEHGSSRQAPTGMISQAFVAGLAEAKRQKLLGNFKLVIDGI